jgi:hypothetical protein
VLAGLECGDGDLGVEVAGRADVDDVDVVALYDRAPVSGRLGPAVACRGLLDGAIIATDEHLLPDLRSLRVEGADVAPGVGVGLAHEGVADDGDTEGAVGLRHGLQPPVVR